MIPKVLYLYWGGKPLSWLRYLTVVSFAKHNPDWRIVVYYPIHPTTGYTWDTGEQVGDYTGKNYFGYLEKFAELRPFDAEWVQMSNGLPEVHKSDLFRVWVLREFGGVYADFDILFGKPMPDTSGKKKLYHFSNGYYSIGFLGALKGDKTMDYLLDEANRRTYTTGYQAYGSILWNTMLDGVVLDGWNIPTDLVYPYSPTEAAKLFTDTKPLPHTSIGVHWYGGSSVGAEYEEKLLPTTYMKQKSTIAKLIKGVL